MSYWSHNPELFTEIIFKQMKRRLGMKEEENEEMEKECERLRSENQNLRERLSRVETYIKFRGLEEDFKELTKEKGGKNL